jgi:glycine/D-amino acid oxidase-like deaminating enzyme
VTMYFTPRRYPYRALDSDQRDVIVAGAGPVGLSTALGLARRGVQVTLLEQHSSVCFGSRAICLSRHSLEVLDRLGVGGAITRQAVPWYGGRSYLRDVEVLSFDMPQARTHQPTADLRDPRPETPAWLMAPGDCLTARTREARHDARRHRRTAGFGPGRQPGGTAASALG